jgi:hypothetical protein
MSSFAVKAKRGVLGWMRELYVILKLACDTNLEPMLN